MSVTFSDDIETIIIPNNEQEDRSIGSMYYRDLIQRCEHAERELVKMINDNCNNKIILIAEGYPLTVRDTHIPWYQDDTVCKIHTHICNTQDFAEYFYKLFDNEVARNINLYAINEFDMYIDGVKFYFNKVLRLPPI
jgi:hypothetical protein